VVGTAARLRSFNSANQFSATTVGCAPAFWTRADFPLDSVAVGKSSGQWVRHSHQVNRQEAFQEVMRECMMKALRQEGFWLEWFFATARIESRAFMPSGWRRGSDAN
jgi:Leu/Phe-tRNA-protein transferase